MCDACVTVSEAMKQHEEKMSYQTGVQRTVSMPSINDTRMTTRPMSAIFPTSHASVPEDDELDSGIGLS